MPVYVGRLECATCGHQILQHAAREYPNAAQAEQHLASALIGWLAALQIPCCRECESTRLYVTIAEQQMCITWRTAPHGGCTYLSERWFLITGHPPGTDLGYVWRTCVHPEDLPQVWHAYAEAFNARRPFSVQWRLRRANGSYVWIYGKGYPQFGADNSFDGYWGFAFELTDSLALAA